ncbi:MAG: AtpZ/AtpI family protein [Actinomycetota bacterium]|jgi:F0F1-type ATP synthase assembly protein I|nr:AtpZ/AtpI family protein [Actinomycetota bacterium]
MTSSSNEGSGHGVELALLVFVYLLIGIGLDAWLNTQPIFTITLVLFAVIGQFVKTYYVYNARMKQLEEERVEATRARPEQ